MPSSPKTASPAAMHVEITPVHLTVTLSDGRVISVPITWYPRLSHARPEDRENFRLVGQGYGIHWPTLDEDISVDNLLFGQPSGESAQSFARWKTEYYRRAAEDDRSPTGE